MNGRNSKSTRALKAAEHRRTPRRWRVGYAGRKIRQVLECGAAVALWIYGDVQGPNARSARPRAVHDPSVWSPGFSRSGPPEGGTPYRWLEPARFMVTMHGRKAERALHEPARPSNRSLPWESGAEDARTPNADAWSADSAASAKRLECVRFIGALAPAPEWFITAMHDFQNRRCSP